MIVGVQEGLFDIKQKLIEKGYKVIDVSNIMNNHLDVFIYKSSCVEGIFQKYNFKDTRENEFINNQIENNNRGVFFVNALGKSINEITNIIDNRCYTPLKLT